MKRIALALALLPYLAAGVIAQTPAGPPASAKLTMAAPEKVPAGSGFVEVTVKGTDSVLFDVFAVFEDSTAKVQSKAFGTTLVVGIPASAGAIRVTAAGVIGGKPVLVSAVITVESKEDKDKTDGPAGKPPAAPRLHVTVIGLPESASLRKSLEDAGLRYWPYASVPAGRADLTKQAAKAGTPCAIVQTPDGKVVAAQKVATEADVVNAVNGLGK